MINSSVDTAGFKLPLGNLRNPYYVSCNPKCSHAASPSGQETMHLGLHDSTPHTRIPRGKGNISRLETLLCAKQNNIQGRAIR